MAEEQLNGSADQQVKRLASVFGLLYLALLPFNIEFDGPVFAHDIVALAFVFYLLSKRGWRAMTQGPERYMAAFLVIAAISTAVHACSDADLYELTIFIYMTALFLFFSRARVPGRILFWYGLATLAVMSVYAAVQYVSGSRDVYAVYTDTALDFMAERFFFTFSHPNLTGSFFVLPVSCVLMGAHYVIDLRSRRQIFIALSVLLLLCVPLLMTVSRHMILTLAVVLGWGVSHLSRDRSRWPVYAASGLLLAVFGLFCLTFIFPFFPLKVRFPFFNSETYGMYMIHQTSYAKMILMNPGTFLLGIGRTGVFRFYPLFVDWEQALLILAQYRQEFLLDNFVTYMDAHQEYLNLAASFGVPATALIYIFWFMKAGKAHSSDMKGMMLVFFVSAVFMASFWDDILSKRWIWITLGILSAEGEDE